MIKIKSALYATTLLTTLLFLTTGQANAGSGGISYQVNYVSTFATGGSGAGQLNGPEQITLGLDGNLYIADRGNNRIDVFDSSGNYISQFGSGQLSVPVGVTFALDGKIVTTELSGNEIKIFDPVTYTYTGPIGSGGSGPGQFNTTYYIKPDAAGNLYVADYANNRIQVLDHNGAYVTEFANGVHTPSLAIGTNNRIYVSDFANSNIFVYDSSYNLVGTLATLGSANGQVDLPYGMSVDAQNNLYVADFLNNRIQIFDPNGNFLLAYNTTDSPNGLDVGPDGKIYITQYNSSNAQILTLTSTETFNGSPAGGNETAATPLSNLILVGPGTFADNFIGYHGIETNGNWTLSGNSSFTGQFSSNYGTLINDGTLSFEFGGNYGSIVNNGTININNYFQITGSFTNNGTINLNNQIINYDIFTNNGLINGNVTNFGTYSGSGSVSGNFNGEGGTIDLGAANRTLSIGGNYTNNGVSTYIVEADAAGQASKISVTGTAAINAGSVVQVNASNGIYHVNNSYIILTAAGGVTGTFASVTDNLAFLDPTLSYTANVVTLTLTRNDGIDPFPPNVNFTPYAASSNDAAAATALSAYSANSFNGDTATFDAVQSLSVSDARKLLNEVSPDQVAAMPAIQNAMITSMQAPMFQRLQSAPVSSSDKSGFGFITPDNNSSGITPDQVWLQTIGGVSNQDNSSNGAAGYRLGTVGVRGGADKDIDDKTKLGLSFAYAHGTANYKGSNDSSQTQYAHADLYGRHELSPVNQHNLVLEGFLGAGGGRIDSTRYITAGTLNNTIIGNTNAYDVSGAVKLSNPIRLTPSDIITPNITTAASWTRQNGYTETGSPFALQMNSITSTPVTVTPMVNWQHMIKDEKHGFNLTPDLGIGATWQLSELNNNVNANFANSTTAPSFTTQSAKQDPLSLNLSAAVTMQPFTNSKYVPQLTAQATMQSSSTTTNTTGTLTAKWDW